MILITYDRIFNYFKSTLLQRQSQFITLRSIKNIHLTFLELLYSKFKKIPHWI